MKQSALDDFSELERSKQRLWKLMLLACVVITVCLWGIAFVPSTYTMIGKAKFVHRGVFLFILSIAAGYFFAKYAVKWKPKIEKTELLLKLWIVWVISELIYHGIEKLILHDTPIFEFAKILLLSSAVMIAYSSIVAVTVFSKMRKTQNHQTPK